MRHDYSRHGRVCSITHPNHSAKIQLKKYSSNYSLDILMMHCSGGGKTVKPMPFWHGRAHDNTSTSDLKCKILDFSFFSEIPNLTLEFALPTLSCRARECHNG